NAYFGEKVGTIAIYALSWSLSKWYVPRSTDLHEVRAGAEHPENPISPGLGYFFQANFAVTPWHVLKCRSSPVGKPGSPSSGTCFRRRDRGQRGANRTR